MKAFYDRRKITRFQLDFFRDKRKLDFRFDQLIENQHSREQGLEIFLKISKTWNIIFFF